ncbi:MAG: beta strand repeat-containing protein [Tepidisphaerales bacterium]
MSKSVTRRASRFIKRSLVLGAAVAGLSLFSAGRASAANFTWTGSGDAINWSNFTNWDVGGIPATVSPADGDTLIFNAGSPATNNDLFSLSAGLGSLQFTAAGPYNVQGAQILLDGGVTVNTIANVSLYNALGVNTTIGPEIVMNQTAVGKTKVILNNGTLSLTNGLKINQTAIRGSGTTTVAATGTLEGIGGLTVGSNLGDAQTLVLRNTYSTFTGGVKVQANATLDIQTTASLGDTKNSVGFYDNSTLRISGPNIVAPGVDPSDTSGGTRTFVAGGLLPNTIRFDIPDPAGALALGFSGNAGQLNLHSSIVLKTGLGTFALSNQTIYPGAMQLQNGRIANGGTAPISSVIVWQGGGVTSTGQNTTFSGQIDASTLPLLNPLVLDSNDFWNSGKDYLTTLSGPMADGGAAVTVTGNASTTNVKGFALTDTIDDSGGGSIVPGLTGQWTVKNGGMLMLGHHYDANANKDVYAISSTSLVKLDNAGASGTQLGPVAGILTDGLDQNNSPHPATFPTFAANTGSGNYGYFIGSLTAAGKGQNVAYPNDIPLSGQQFSAIGKPGDNDTLTPASITPSAASTLYAQDVNLSLGSGSTNGSGYREFGSRLTIRGNGNGSVLADGGPSSVGGYQFTGGLTVQSNGTLRASTGKNIVIGSAGLSMQGGAMLFDRSAGTLTLNGNVDTTGGMIQPTPQTSGSGLTVDLGGGTRNFNISGNGSLLVKATVNNGAITVSSSGGATGEVHFYDASGNGTATGLTVNSGTVHLSGNPVPNAGTIQMGDGSTLAIGVQDYLPGLHQTVVTNNGTFPLSPAGATLWDTPSTPTGLHGVSMGFDMGQTSGVQNGNGANLPTGYRWGDNTNFFYSGQFYTATGHIAFGKNIDDAVQILVDGNQVLNNNTWNANLTTGDLNLTPGWHNIQVDMYNGGGGAGAVSGGGWSAGSGTVNNIAQFDGKGFGINTTPGLAAGNADGTTFTVPVDDGTASLLRYAATIPFSGSNAVKFNGSTGTINTDGYGMGGSAMLPSVIMAQSGATLTTKGLGNLTLPSVTVAGDTNFNVINTTRITGLTLPASPVTLSMTGSGTLLMDQPITPPLTNTTTLKAQNGTLTIADLGAGVTSNGAAPIVLAGGNLNLLPGTYAGTNTLIERIYGQAQGITTNDNSTTGNQKYFYPSPSRAINPNGFLGVGVDGSTSTPAFTYTYTGSMNFTDNIGNALRAHGATVGVANWNNGSNDGDAGIWTGVVNLQAGQYTFGTLSDDASHIYIDFDHSGIFESTGRVVTQTGCCGVVTNTVTIPAAGQYAIAIAWENGGGGSYVQAQMGRGAGLAWGAAGMYFINDPNNPDKIGQMQGTFTNLDLTAQTGTNSTITGSISLTNVAVLKMQPNSAVNVQGGPVNFTGIHFDANTALNPNGVLVRSGTLVALNSSAALTVGSTNGGRLLADDQVNAPTFPAGSKIIVGNAGLFEARHDVTGAVNPVAGAEVNLGYGTFRVSGTGTSVMVNGLAGNFYTSNNGATRLNNGMQEVRGLTPNYTNPVFRTSLELANSDDVNNNGGTPGPMTFPVPRNETAFNVPVGTFPHDNYTTLFTGLFTVPAGQGGVYTFYTRSDDGNVLMLTPHGNAYSTLQAPFSGGAAGANNNWYDNYNADAVPAGTNPDVIVNNNNDQGETTRWGTKTLAAGSQWDFAMGARQGGGGAGESAWFSGPLTGGAQWMVNPADPRQAGLWQVQGQTAVDFTSTDVGVNGTGILDIEAVGGANFRNLNLYSGTMTMAGAVANPTHFTGTVINGGATISNGQGFDIFGGQLSQIMGGMVIKQGVANLVFDNSANASNGITNASTLQIQGGGGNVIVIGSDIAAPLGGNATTSGMQIQFSNNSATSNTLAIASSADGKTILVPSDVTAFSGGTILAGVASALSGPGVSLAPQGVAAATAGSIKVELGNTTNTITLSGGSQANPNILNLSTNSNYELDVNSSFNIPQNAQVVLNGLMGGLTSGGSLEGTLLAQSGTIAWPNAAITSNNFGAPASPSTIQVNNNGASLGLKSFSGIGLVNLNGGTLRTSADSSAVSIVVPGGVAGTLDNTAGGVITTAGLTLGLNSTLNLPRPTAGGLVVTNPPSITNATINNAGDLNWPAVNLVGTLTKGGAGTLTLFTGSPLVLTTSNGFVATAGKIVLNQTGDLTMAGHPLTLGSTGTGQIAINGNFPAINPLDTLIVQGSVTLPPSLTTLTNGGTLSASVGVTDFSTITIAGNKTTKTVTMNGFGSDGNTWQINQSDTATGTTSVALDPVNGDVLTLTTQNNGQGRSIFSTKHVPVSGGFTASFVYTTQGNIADGMAVVFQNDPRAQFAVGANGGALGYGGATPISPSGAIDFNLYPGNGNSGTRYGTNGATGGYTATAPVVLGDASGTTYETQVGLVFNPANNTITETLTAMQVGSVPPVPVVPAVTKTVVFNANPALDVGLPTAYFGFTGGTGGANALQTISDFTYTGQYNTANLVVQNGGTLKVAGFTNHSLVALGTGTLTTVDPTVASSTDSLVTLPNGTATLNIATGGTVTAGVLQVNSGSTLNLPSPSANSLIVSGGQVYVTDATINHAAAMTFPVLNLSGTLNKGGIVQPDTSVLSGDLNITTLNRLTPATGINANAGNVNLAPAITIGAAQTLGLGGLSADGKSAGMINLANTPLIDVGGTLRISGRVGINVPTTTLTNNGSLIAGANSLATITGPGPTNLKIVGTAFAPQGITAPGLNMSWSNVNNDVNGMDNNGGLLTATPTGSAVFTGQLNVDGFTGGPNGQNGGFVLLTGKPLGDPAGINATNYGFVWKGVFIPKTTGFYQFGGGDTNNGGPGLSRIDDNAVVFLDLNHNGSIDAATEKLGGTGCCGAFSGSNSSNPQGVAYVNRVPLLAGVAYPITVGFGQGGGDAGMSLAVRNVTTAGAFQVVDTNSTAIGQWGLAATGPANYSQITVSSGATLAVDSFTSHYAVNLAGTLQLTSATAPSDTVNLIATGAGGVLTVGAGGVSAANLFVGDGNALVVNGTGALTVANSVSVGTTLGTALLNINNPNGLNLPANTILDNGSVLNSGPGPVTLNGGTVLGTGRLGAVSGQSVQVNGPIGGSGGLAVLWQSGGIVQLNAVNTYTGTTTIGSQGGPGFVSVATSSATLRIGVDNAFSVNSRLNYNGPPVAGMIGIVDLNGHPIGVRGFSGGTNAYIDNTSATPVTLTTTGDISDNPAYGGLIENSGGGALTLIVNHTSSAQNLTTGGTNYSQTITGTANTYTGGTVLKSGILQINADGSLGNPTGTVSEANLPADLQGKSLGGIYNIVFDGGQLMNNNSSPTLSATRNILIGTGGAFVRDGWGVPITIQGKMSGPGGFNVVWDGGPLTISGANDYAGDTTIGVNGNGFNASGAALVLGASNSIPSGAGKGNLVFGNDRGSSLNLNGFNQTVNGLTGGNNASIFNDAGNSTSVLAVGANNANGNFGGTIRNGNGAVALTKVGTGMQILGGTNTYSGPTTISAGTIQMAPTTIQNVADFTNTGAWTKNGSGGWNGSVLQLTTGTTGQQTSAFFNTKMPVNAPFNATYTFTDVGGGGADGSAFVLQNSSLTALGGGGGGLGFNGITPSAGVELNIYSGNAGNTRYGANGATGTPYAATGAVNVASGDPIQVNVTYDGNNILTEQLTDLTTLSTFSTSYVVGSLASQVGGNTAWVGFTGASGGVASAINITNFSITSTVHGGLLPTATAVIMDSNTTLDLNGVSQQIGSLADAAGNPTGQRVLLGSATLTVGDSTTTSFSGVISGAGGLSKVGGGTLTLAGANAYGGPTTVNAGTLNLNAGIYPTLNVPAGIANLNAPATATNVNITGGLMTAGAGSTVTGTLTATSGTLRVTDSPTAVATVGTADFSNGTPTVNTQSGSLAITNQLKLPGVTANYTAGGSATSFTARSVGGSNIADNSAARTLTLSGGTVAFTFPAPAVTGLNIGAPTIGSYTYDSTAAKWTVHGAGGDMWGGTEESYFVFRNQNNTAFDVSGYVNITGATDGWTKAGIMAAGGTAAAPAAPFVFMATTVGNGVAFQRSDTTQNTNGAGANLQDWVRLTYDGAGNFTGYYSSQPSTTDPASLTWTSLGTYAGAMPNNFELGLMTCSHSGATILATAEFTNVFLSTSPTPFVNLPNTNVATTASSTLDLGNATGNHTLGGLDLTAGATTTALTVQNGATLTLNGDTAGNAISATGSAGQSASIVAGANAPTLMIAAGKNVSVDPGVTLTVGTVIGGANNLTKIGGGTLVLTNANTYTGGTALTGGTLRVTNTTGSATGTGDVTLNGGTLASGAVGSIAGNVLAGSGVHFISPGGDGAIGTLAVGGGLTLSSNSFLRFDITSTTVLDQITAGALAVNVTTTPTVEVPGSLATGNYKLIGFASGTVTPSEFLLTLIGGGAVPASYSLSTTADAGFLDLVVGSGGPPTYNWKGTTSDWHTAGNWVNTIPGATQTAVFSDVTGTGATVDLGNANGTVGGLIFNTNVAGVTIESTGTGKLVLDNGGSAVGVDVTGSHSITASMVSTAAVNKTGPGTLTLGGNNSGLTGGFNINAGVVATATANALGGAAATATVGAAGTLQVGAPGINLAALSNSGIASLNGGASSITAVTGTGALTVGTGASLAAKSVRESALTVNGTVTLPAKASGGLGIVLGSLITDPTPIAPAPAPQQTTDPANPGVLTLGAAGAIDVNDSFLMINYSSVNPIAQVAAALKAGRDAAGLGASPPHIWDGPTGIMSSAASASFTANLNTEIMALGVGDTQDMLKNIGLSFNNIDGVPLGEKTVFVKYTHMGDASLDGYVTNADVTIVSTFYGKTGAYWYQGDFNGDGVVNDADVTIVGTYYQGASPPVFANQSSAFAQAFMAGYDSSHSSSSGTSVVPEPGALSLLGLGALALIRRRRRA